MLVSTPTSLPPQSTEELPKILSPAPNHTNLTAFFQKIHISKATQEQGTQTESPSDHAIIFLPCGNVILIESQPEIVNCECGNTHELSKLQCEEVPTVLQRYF